MGRYRASSHKLLSSDTNENSIIIYYVIKLHDNTNMIHKV